MFAKDNFVSLSKVWTETCHDGEFHKWMILFDLVQHSANDPLEVDLNKRWAGKFHIIIVNLW